MLQKRMWIYFLLLVIVSCVPVHTPKDNKMNVDKAISDNHINMVVAKIKEMHGEELSFRIERGVAQVAELWQATDGSENDFTEFCVSSFVGDETKLKILFDKLQHSFETLFGYFHKIDAELKVPLHLEGPTIDEVDMMFGSYDVSAHLTDDLYANKIAFVVALNFPYYSLEEKSKLSDNWSRQDWAYSRMGDMFTSRVPASVQQNISKTLTEADAYISDYNIYMGHLINDSGEHLFPKDMKLITHWGL